MRTRTRTARKVLCNEAIRRPIELVVTSSSSQSVSRAKQLRMGGAIEAAHASPDYVVEVPRDGHRHRCSYDLEADPS